MIILKEFLAWIEYILNKDILPDRLALALRDDMATFFGLKEGCWEAEIYLRNNISLTVICSILNHYFEFSC